MRHSGQGTVPRGCGRSIRVSAAAAAAVDVLLGRGLGGCAVDVVVDVAGPGSNIDDNDNLCVCVGVWLANEPTDNNTYWMIPDINVDSEGDGEWGGESGRGTFVSVGVGVGIVLVCQVAMAVMDDGSCCLSNLKRRVSYVLQLP